MKGNVIMVAIVCITILEAIALCIGYNGVLLTAIVGVIAGLAGLVTKTPKLLEKVM
jgi:hypothetical protein